MKLLLDTHVFLWFVLGDMSLSSTARQLIENPAHEKFVSVASVWEVAIKYSLGKISLSSAFPTFMPQHIRGNGFNLLNISLEHCTTVSSLAFHHRDPFDRLIIAQAMVEGMTIISKDTAFDYYGVAREW